jgi:hypothetical protein
MFFRQRVTLQRRTTWSCTALEYLSARQREHVGSDSLSLMPCAPSTRRGIKTMPSRRFLPPPDVRPRLSPEAVHYSIFRVHPYAVQREKTCPRGKPVCSKANLMNFYFPVSDLREPWPSSLRNVSIWRPLCTILRQATCRFPLTTPELSPRIVK